MGNELKHIHNTYDADAETKVISWDKNLIDKLASLCKSLVPFEHPDAYAKFDDEVLIFEHFEFDSSVFKKKKGTQQRRSEAEDDRAFDAVIPTEEGTIHRGEIKANYSIKNYRENLERSFSKHYNEIPEYKKDLRENGTITDDSKITTIFFIEDKTELGNIYESEKEGVPWEPLVLPLCAFFLDIFENSPDLDIAICASWYPSQHCLWCIDRTMISKCREYAVDTDSIEIINWNPQSTGIKMIVSKEALSEKQDRFGEKVCCNPTVKLQKGESYPLIDIDKITPGYKTVKSTESIEYTGQGGAKFQDHDILFARITPCLENGKVAIADTDGQNGIGSTELFVFRGIKDVSDTDYIYYLLQMKHIRQLAANSMSGASGRQRADLDFIKRIKWNFPNITEQKRIAEVLSVYDNLIEVNNKRIMVLEQMAENLYKEWFVRFRFPGHETAEFENGIPKGWEKQRIKDFCTFANGFAFKSEEYNEAGKYIVVTIKNVQDGKLDLGSIEKIDFVPDGMPDYCKLSKGDVLMSLTGNVGRVCIVTEDNCLLNQRVSKLISKYPYYTYEFFRQDAMYQVLCNIAYGTAQLNLSPILAGKIKVFMSPAGLQKKYNDLVSPLFQRIRIIADESKNLIKQRDLLLPRLMSGKLEV